MNCLTPMVTLEKIVHGKYTTVSKPLLPNYMFVESNPEVIHTTAINATCGVSHLIRFNATPTAVPPSITCQLSIYKPGGIMDPQTPQPGDSMTITEGAFKELKAVFTGPGDEARSTLPPSLLNKEVEQSVKSIGFGEI